MKKKKFYLILFFLILFFAGFTQVPFIPGNIVVYRVGDGSVTLNSSASPLFLDEYTPTGTLVQSIAMPTTASGINKIVTNSGTATSGGMITVSTNGQYIVLTGFNAPVGTASINNSTVATIPRLIGLVKYNAVINTSTALTDLSDQSIVTSAVSTNGTDLWACGMGTFNSTGGVRYTTTGSTTSTQLYSTVPNNLRSLNITNGQLYLAASTTPRVGKVGAGLPTTSGQIITALPGFPNTGTPAQFVFVDLDASISGPDVLYVAYESAGIQKFSLVAGSWTSNGIVGVDADDYRGLTAIVSGTTVSLFATKKGTNGLGIGGGDLVKIIDASGYNEANGTFVSSSLNVIASTPVDTKAFRGVALVPQPPTPKVAVKIFLQGAYSGSGFHKDVNGTWAGILNTSALSQPYNVAPFNYAGTENVSSGFFTSNAATTDIMDWVLVELRDATTPTTVVATRAAFVREDGKVVDVDGTSDVSFPGVADGSYYIVIRHRNHLGVRSANTISLGNGTAATYDFTTSQSQAYQDAAITPTNDAMKDLGGGVFGLWAGNANGNTNVRFTGLNNDAGIILSALGGNQAILLSSTYNSGDLNLDGTVRYTGLNNDAGVLLGVLGSDQAKVYGQHQ